ncbi:MAG TPA: hypothetical protein DER33_04190 [Syntrophomonas sp.]|jgi:surface polysaccharide O-acyltransferase-like enzyme|nr:hypothetical protein [Syntrophomonas sp.]HCF70781.1 hypothetical protein [Syntrophomonas sp.]
MKRRLQEFDILRVIAAFAVIGIHITAGYATLTALGYTLNQLVRFAVPMFIIISGFLLYYIDLTGGFKSAAVFYRKRFGHVLWPYFIWTVVYFIVGLIISGGYSGLGNMLAALAKHLLWGTACYHLYFLVIIFQLYLIYPLLRTSIAKWPHSTVIISFLITLLSQTILYFNMMSKLPLPNDWQCLYLVAFPVWVFYFVLGMYVAFYREKCNAIVQKNVVWLGFIWVFSTALLFIDSKLTSTYATSMRPSVILYTVCTYFFGSGLALSYKKKLGNWIYWLSNQSFLIFLMHPLFLTGLLYGSQHFAPSLWDGNPGMVMLYLATCVLTLIAVWVISLSRLAPYLGGATRISAK